jgi:alginate O-acetyltransferase complex protein AlgI
MAGLTPITLEGTDAMLFCSQAFLIFFLAVFSLYWSAGILPRLLCRNSAERTRQIRILLLLIASFYFYASWNKWLALLVFGTTILDYFFALGMDSPRRSHGQRTFLLTMSLVMNLGILCYLKYVNFFLHSLEEALHAVGGTASLPVLRVILPIGISFYTFEAINYTVDVYRRKVRPERNLPHFLLFITFFPHLVAGPIVRARDFLPQIRRRKHWDWVRMQLGAQYVLMGLFKKMAIADRMAAFADPVFQNPEQYGTYATWLAIIAYTLQIYCDFSGYTDIAIGTAHMLGYRLAQNFNMPYLSTNVSEFWRRWHISLSSWLRDYLFIPLGGSRGSKWATNRNLMITMTLGGLWHGANWTFVVWGILHGGLLIVHRQFQDFCKRLPSADRLARTVPGTALRIGLTLLSVMVCWVFFRAETFTHAATFLRHLFVPTTGLPAPLHHFGLWLTLAVVVVSHVVGYLGWEQKALGKLPAPAIGFSYAVILTLALLLSPDTGKAFIYFQF